MTRGLRVLLVDDDHEDARLFARRAPARFRVEHVTGGTAARRCLEREAFDLCFVDYRLGPDDGLEVVRRLREADQALPIVVITGCEVGSLGENALLSGATDFIEKQTLSTATLERAARWALIRRHVERLGADAHSARALAAVLARPSPAAPAGEPLRRLAYLSRARVALGPADLLALCARFAAANARVGLTGVLVVAGDRFMQVLEGPAPAVDAVMARIAADTRHGDLAVVLDLRAAQRLYADWGMGYLQLEERFPDCPERWLKTVQDAARDLGAIAHDRAALDRFVSGLPRLLRGRDAVSSAA